MNRRRKKLSYTIRLDRDVIERLEVIAEESGVPRNEIIREGLGRHLDALDRIKTRVGDRRVGTLVFDGERDERPSVWLDPEGEG